MKDGFKSESITNISNLTSSITTSNTGNTGIANTTPIVIGRAQTLKRTVQHSSTTMKNVIEPSVVPSLSSTTSSSTIATKKTMINIDVSDKGKRAYKPSATLKTPTNSTIKK